MLQSRRFLLCCYLTASVLLSTCSEVKDSSALDSIDQLRKSIFKIHVVSQDPRYSQPWLLNKNSRSSGSGFYIGQSRVMTNAHVVAHARFITVQRDGDDQPIQAKVSFIAHDSDLAILTIEDEGELQDVNALEFGGMPSLQDKVSTIGYPRGGEQISVTEGVVSRISYRRYAHIGDVKHLLVQVDSAINPGNSGGPVFKGNKVIGVAFQSHTKAENTGYIIPTPVVKRFLDDIKDGSYEGHPEDGITIVEGALENEATRSFHRLKSGRGVKLGYIASFSPLAAKLSSGDVITKIGGKEIGVDGKVELYEERVDFRVVLDLAQIGEHIDLEVYREGQAKTFEVLVSKNAKHYQQSNVHEEQARYVIFGGLVFTALSRDYLKTWGDRWYFRAPVDLRYVHHYFFDDEFFSHTEDVIVLAEVLTSFTNKDATLFKDRILTTIDDQKIRSLKDLKNYLNDPSAGKLFRFGFWQESKPLLLPSKALRESHAELLEKYKVSSDHFLP